MIEQFVEFLSGFGIGVVMGIFSFLEDILAVILWAIVIALGVIWWLFPRD